MTELIEPVYRTGEDLKPHVIDRQEYVKFGESEGFHPHDVIMSWYYLANDFVYKMQPESRAHFRDDMGQRNGTPIEISFALHPPDDRKWLDQDMAEIDQLDIDSLERYLALAVEESQRSGQKPAEWLGRRCKPQMIELWQKLVSAKKVPQATLE